MPSYDYHCPLCQASVKVIKSIHSTEEEMCTNCKVPLIKAFYAPGVTFKGSGWGHQSNQS